MKTDLDDHRKPTTDLKRERAVAMIAKVEASRPGVRLFHLDVNPDVQCIMYVGEIAGAVFEMCYLPEEFEALSFVPIDRVKAEYGHEVGMKDKKTGASIPLRYFYFVEFQGGEIYYAELQKRYERVGVTKLGNLGIANLPLDMFKKLTG